MEEEDPVEDPEGDPSEMEPIEEHDLEEDSEEDSEVSEGQLMGSEDQGEETRNSLCRVTKLGGLRAWE